MAKKLYSEEHIQNIADKIRKKNKKKDTYKVSEMADAIDAIPTGEDPRYKEATGESSLSYDLAKADELKSAEYKGNVEQKILSGKNIWELPNNSESNGITFTKNSDGTFNLSGTATKDAYFKTWIPIDEFENNAQYTLSSNGNVEGFEFRFEEYTAIDGAWVKQYSKIGNNQPPRNPTATVVKGTGTYVRLSIFCYSGKTLNVNNVKVQLEKNSTETEWEAYCGGTASPNPDYPQEVKTLKSYQLFDKDNANILKSVFLNPTGNKIDTNTSSAKMRTLYIDCKPNTTYTVTKKYSARFSVASSTTVSVGDACTKLITNSSATKITITTEQDDKYLLVYYYHSNDTIPEQEILDSILIIEGDELKPYLPYNSIGVKRTGKNLFDKDFGSGYFRSSGVLTTPDSNWKYCYSNVKPNTKYRIAGVSNIQDTIGIVEFDKNNNFIKYISYKNQIFTTQSNTSYIGISSRVVDKEVFMVYEGNETIPYEPYKEEIQYIDLDSNEVLTDDEIQIDRLGNAKVVKKWEKVDLSTLNIYQETTAKSKRYRFDGIENLIKKPSYNGETINLLCEIYIKNNASWSWNTTTGKGISVQTNGSIIIFDDGYTTSESFTNFKNMINEKKPLLYYPLAEPQIIDLPKCEPLKSLEGTNNVEILATLEPTFMKEEYVRDIKQEFLDNGAGSATENGTNSLSYDYALDYDVLDSKIRGNVEQKTSILPSEYTQVEYIESTGTQYIDTGVNADNNLRVVLDMQYTDISVANNTNYGVNYSSGSTIRYHMMCQGGIFRFYTQNSPIDLSSGDTSRHLFDFDVPNNLIIVDDKKFTKTSNSFDTQLNFWLFGRNSNLDNLKYYNSSKLYSSQMHYNNELVRDFIPCYRKSDNVIGLYDLVNDVFYTNQGTGTFIKGSDVTIPNPDYPQEVKTLKGYNLFDKDLFEEFTTSIKYIDLTLKPNTYYTMASDIPTQSTNTDNANLFFMRDGETASSRLNGVKPNQPRTLLTDSTGKVQIGYRDYVGEYDDEKNKYIYQIVEGTKSKPYLPYDNIGKRHIGKNLFDKDNVEIGKAINVNGVEVNLGAYEITDYILTTQPKGILKFYATQGNQAVRVHFYDKEKKWLSQKSISTLRDNITTLKFDIPNNAHYMRVSIHKDFTDIMLCFGDTETEYEPYKEEIQYIDLDNNEVLTDDKIQIDSKGNVKLIKTYKKYVFNGSENWTMGFGTSMFDFQHAFDNEHFIARKKAYSTVLKYNDVQSGIYTTLKNNEFALQYSTNNNTYNLFVKDERFTNVADFKNYLSEYNLEILVPMETPQIIDLPKCEPLKSLEGTNNVEILATLEPTSMSETYVKGYKKYVEDLETAVLDLGGEI